MSPIPSAVRERSERRGRVGCIPKWLTADSHRWRGASVDNFNLLFPYEILDVLAIELNYVQLSKLRNNLIDWTPCSKLDAVETGWSRQGLLLSPRLQTSLTAQWRRGWERWRCWLTGTGSSSWEGGKVREGYLSGIGRQNSGIFVGHRRKCSSGIWNPEWNCDSRIPKMSNVQTDRS